MIYYTSGTGNSQAVARRLAELTDDKAVAVDYEMASVGPLGDKRLIFVMPVHSWGPALFMMRFIKRAAFDKTISEAWAVFVCGDNCGNADKILARALKKKNITLRAAFSVQMPNNYILMKGFGTDDEDLANKKIADSELRIPQIVAAISNDSVADKTLYVRGSKPGIKSGLVYPLFARMAVKSVKFYATAACIGCGLCEKVCPTHNIKLTDGRPVWGKDCVQCVACIHRCPKRAIEYGKVSQNMGRYVHPDLRQTSQCIEK